MRSFTKVRQEAIALIIVASIIGFMPDSRLAMAHHSGAMFDKEVVRQRSATVREFQWTNPHVWIQIYFENENGDQEEWRIEGGGPNTLFRRGWRPNSFKPGDIVEIKFNPVLEGSTAGFFVGATLADGKTLGNW